MGKFIWATFETSLEATLLSTGMISESVFAAIDVVTEWGWVLLKIPAQTIEPKLKIARMPFIDSSAFI